MKSLKHSLLAVLAAATLTLSVSAQQSNAGTQQQNQDMQNMPGMQMKNDQMQHSKKMSNDQMMQGCHKNMQSMMDSNAQTTKDIKAAKQSNDPAKMRAALDEADKALTGMNDHMKMCSHMMQDMHDGMMSDQQKQKKQEQTTPKQ